jgi:hypothetical protein
LLLILSNTGTATPTLPFNIDSFKI